MIEYKRKFLVPGDTKNKCTDFCPKYFIADRPEDLPPCIRDVAIGLKRTWNLWDSMKEMKKCPYKDQLRKPNEYIVSETEDGEWQCSCKAWTAHKPRKDCKHILKVKADPAKYEIAKEWTGKTIETMKKAFQ